MTTTHHSAPLKDRTAAERQRRRRLRRKCGLQIHAIEIEPEVLTDLLERGFISVEDLKSKTKLAFALGIAIEDLLRNTVTA